MNDGARDTGGLDPARDRNPRRRTPWGRRSPYGHPRQLDGGRPLAATYGALDLGTNNCRLLVARPTNEGFRVVDAFSRTIVGWRVASHMRTGMVLDALEMARCSRGTQLEGLRCHSDAGSQPRFNQSTQHRLVGASVGVR